MSLNGGSRTPISWQRKVLYWSITALLSLAGIVFFAVEVLQGISSRQTFLGALSIVIFLTSVGFIIRTVGTR